MKFPVSIITLVTLLFIKTGNATPLPVSWNASWIAAPGDDGREYGVYYFRKQIELAARPAGFIIHVSADNRYKLFVNDSLVSLGPARGDLYNWNYETVDLAPYLVAGKNIISAMVWNEADLRSEEGKVYALKIGENKLAI